MSRSERGGGPSRRRFLLTLGATAAGLALDPLSLIAKGRESAARAGPMRIGIIGSGRQGGSIGLLWADAGHEIVFSSRHPDELTDLVALGGEKCRAGYPEEAARFGEVILIAVPYGALPQVGRDHGPLMEDKVVIECGNPRADRDGPMAEEAIEKGTGVASAEYLPGVRLVRAFNAVSFITVREESFRPGENVGIPMAGDDEEAVATTAHLIRDAGFDPVYVGPLSEARRFDRGTDVYVQGMTAAELREALDLDCRLCV